MVSKKYVVSCYSPPGELKIKNGNLVEVVGEASGQNVYADTITNVTDNGPACECGPPELPKFQVKALTAHAEKFDHKGIVGKLKVGKQGIQFELTTEE